MSNRSNEIEMSVENKKSVSDNDVFKSFTFDFARRCSNFKLLLNAAQVRITLVILSRQLVIGTLIIMSKDHLVILFAVNKPSQLSVGRCVYHKLTACYAKAN